MKTSGLDIGSLPGPDDVLRVTLGNGIVVLAREKVSSPAVVIDGTQVLRAERCGRAVCTAASAQDRNHSFE